MSALVARLLQHSLACPLVLSQDRMGRKQGREVHSGVAQLCWRGEQVDWRSPPATTSAQAVKPQNRPPSPDFSLPYPETAPDLGRVEVGAGLVEEAAETQTVSLDWLQIGNL